MNTSSTVSIRPLRILCVEDQELLGEVLLCLLARAGHWVEHVSDGLYAWDKISSDLSNFDLVITGHLMPGLNGLELVELLREANFCGSVVLYTAGVHQEIAQHYRSLGVSAIIHKTTRAADLLEAVAALPAFGRLSEPQPRC